jgi:signal transduction histidine kinase
MSVPLAKPVLGSLFLRFFGGFAATMLVIWIGVLTYEAVLVQSHFERLQQIETRGWSRQILASLKRHVDHPDQLRGTLREILTVRDDMYHETGFVRPAWRLQVWHGDTLLFALDDGGDQAVSAWSSSEVSDAASGLKVRLSQQRVVAWRFALAATSHQFAPLLYSFPFLLLPAWLSIRRGLTPVRRIVAQLEGRAANDLSALVPSAYRELAPLVDAINMLMTRLSARLARERDFLVDAAHQLKTPLAVIQVNADLLTMAPDGPRRVAAYAGLGAGVSDAAHVTHQLLALARTGREMGNDAWARHDLAELLRSRLAGAAALAIVRHIELDLNAPEQCLMSMCRESMVALIDNLIDNAIKFSPDGAVVDIALEADEDGFPEQTVRLVVRDHGPGIPESLHAQVFERFFRAPGHEMPGSGLGLAIVEHATRQHDATVHLRAAGPGLCVTVSFTPVVSH